MFRAETHGFNEVCNSLLVPNYDKPRRLSGVEFSVVKEQQFMEEMKNMPSAESPQVKKVKQRLQWNIHERRTSLQMSPPEQGSIEELQLLRKKAYSDNGLKQTQLAPDLQNCKIIEIKQKKNEKMLPTLGLQEIQLNLESSKIRKKQLNKNN